MARSHALAVSDPSFLGRYLGHGSTRRHRAMDPSKRALRHALVSSGISALGCGCHPPPPVGSFASFAPFTTASCGAWSVNYLNITAIGDDGESVYLNIATGVTYGAGASSTLGRLIWYPEEIMTYDGRD
jgi:hypothetical protein